MSVPTTVRGQYFDIAVDATSLGLSGYTGLVYLCGLNTRNFTRQVNTSDEAVPDCAKPADVPWRALNATSQQADMSGTGLYNVAQADLVRAIYGKLLPFRFIEAQPSPTDPNTKVEIGHYAGNFMLTNYQEGATDGSYATAQFTFSSDGPVTWTAATQSSGS